MKMLLKLNFVLLLFMLSCDAQPLESNEPLIPIDNYVLKSSSPIDGKKCTVKGSCSSISCSASIECGCDESPECNCSLTQCKCDCVAKEGTGNNNKGSSPLSYQVDITEKYIKTLHELMYFCKSSPESELKTIPALIVKVFEDIQDGDALAYNVSSQYLEDYLQSVQHPAAIKALNNWFAQNDLPYTIPHTSQD